MVMHSTYRIAVQQGSVIRIELPHFFMDEEDEDGCFSYIKIFNGYDETAPMLQDEFCTDLAEPITSDTNIVFIEFQNNQFTRTKFQLKWSEIDKVKNTSNTIENECGDRTIALNNETAMVNITSPGYPYGYAAGLTCYWTILSTIPSFHPVVIFRDVDLEDIPNCVGDYVSVSSDREDGSWKELDKMCDHDIRIRKSFDGTPNLKVKFRSDYGTNRTGFHAYTFLGCGGKMTESEGIIEYNVTNVGSSLRFTDNCMWNITVRRGKTIQFEFLQMNFHNITGGCSSYLNIRNGIDDSSPYLGESQYCGKSLPTIPPTSSNRAFVKYFNKPPLLSSFKLRYFEIQHQCGGQLKLLYSNSSVIITTPNYPNIPMPHIECTWSVFAPSGEQLKIDFLEVFDLTPSSTCEKEYLEMRDGLTTASQLIGTFCKERPKTKFSKSNVLMVKYFTDIPTPHNGFKANISIGGCGGMQLSNVGYLTSPKYPGVGAYPSKTQCDYRIIARAGNVFNITILDIDLPTANETVCDRKKDHITIFSVVPDFNSTGSENLIEEGTFCGSVTPNASFVSNSNAILVKFNTFAKTSSLYKGFKLFYNASKTSCGGMINGDSGVITSPGYPSQTLSKQFCEWKITVPKGRRVKIEFIDVDFMMTKSMFQQRLGVYNDFKYSNRLKFITNNTTLSEPLYSSDNRLMVTMWVRVVTSNRGFKLKYSSYEPTICAGDLNSATGLIYPPVDLNLTSYTCDYVRDLAPIGSSLSQGTIAYRFSDISVGKKISNCRYASTVINVKRRSGATDDESYLARICGNSSNDITVLSPFPDVTIEVRQNPYFGPVNFSMKFNTHKCGGLIQNGGVNYIRSLNASDSQEKIVDCAWFVRYPEGYSIAISITNLTLKLPCDKEFITIHNGPTALSPQLGKYCESNQPGDSIVSQANTIFIEYHTENFNEISKDSKFEMKLESAAAFGCGGIITRGMSTIQTPLYNVKPYLPNTECVWELRADPGYHIGLSFVDRFFIEDSTNCTKDYVEIYDFVSDEWKMLGRRCGRDVPKPFNSTGTKMKVIFRSDANTNGDGFNATWEQNCGGIYEVDTTVKVLQSPGYPKAYGPLLTCNYTFVAKTPKAFINLNFLDFAVETTGSRCMYDNITIYKNPDYIYIFPPVPEKVGTFCGIANPGSFRHKDVTTIIFKSDRWVERKGFYISL